MKFVTVVFLHSDKVYSIGENGHVAVWQCNTSLEGLIPFTEKDEEVEHPDETEEPKQKKPKAGKL